MLANPKKWKEWKYIVQNLRNIRHLLINANLNKIIFQLKDPEPDSTPEQGITYSVEVESVRVEGEGPLLPPDPNPNTQAPTPEHLNKVHTFSV